MVDEVGNLLPHGGLTVAYTLSTKDIMLQTAACRPDTGAIHPETGEPLRDMFCYRVGRMIAAGRLKSPKWEPIILERKDPVKQTIIDYVSMNTYVGPIEIKWNETHKRWESTFDCEVPDAEFELDRPVAQMDCITPPL